MRKSVLAAVAAFAVAGSAMTMQASAADLDFMPAPPPPVIPTWQGFYIGGHVGFGEADFDSRQEFDIFEFDEVEGEFEDGVFNTFRDGLTADGLIGGVQGGYNFQVNRLVFGIEGDVSFADWNDSVDTFDALDGDVEGLLPEEDAFGTAEVQLDMLASVRGRLGFAPGNLLIYGTGGIAWADASAEAEIFFDEDADDGIAGEFLDGDKDFDDIGFVVGGGLGWMVIPQTFSVGVEGLWYFFDEKKTLIDETLVLDNGDEIDVRATASLDDAWVIRARADFHF